MAYGDVGGPVTELIITCKTPDSGAVAINPGDALKLSGDYTVTNATAAEDAIFGQAAGAATENGAPVAVKVRGVCVFAYTGSAPAVNGVAGVLASATDGSVKAPASGNGVGVNLKVDTANSQIHVLL